MGYIFQHPKIYFDIVALLFSLIIVVFTIIKFYETERSHGFKVLLFAIVLTSIVEILRVFAGDLPASTLYGRLKQMAYSATFICSTSTAFAYMRYLDTFRTSRNKVYTVFRTMNFFIYLIFLVFMVLNVNTGWVCSCGSHYDAVLEQVVTDWIRGPFYIPVGYGVPAYFMVFTVLTVLFGMKNQSKRVRITIFASIVATLLGIILQPFLHGKLTITSYCATLSLFIWYFSIENSDYQRLVESTKALKDTEQQAILASKAKSAFLANMSHEIRTPLNAILGLDEMILNSQEKSEIDEYARNIQNSGKSLLSIINDILDFSKIESGKLELVQSPYHLAAMLHDINLMMNLKASRKGLAYKTDIDGNILENLYGDEVRLRQIMTNLLNNAIKYTQQGTVSLKIRGYTEGNTMNLVVEVKDTGIGIKKEDLPSIFARYRRVDVQNNKNIEGSGLGLAIVQSLLKLMDGTIDIESTYGEGSTFTVVIPQEIYGNSTISSYKAAATEKMEQSIEDIFIAPDARVLVVDDNNVNLVVAKGFLKRTQAQVTTCDTGKECLELMKKSKYDIIFLDHMMPEMDGVETLHRSQTMLGNLNRFTPIIALTANAISGMREKYLDLGFTDYISKPIDSHHFYEVFYRSIPQNIIIPKPSAGENEGGKDSSPKPVPEGAVNIDQAAGISMCGGDKSIYLDTVKLFCRDKTETQKKLVQFLMAENWKDYQIVVHALKSNGFLLGCKAFSDLAMQLESACKEIQNNSDVEKQVQFIESHHGEFMRMYDSLAELAAQIS